jgi:hypothetical protein
VLCLAGVALTPFLDAGQVVATEDFGKEYASLRLEGIRPEQRLQVVAAPAGLAMLALLSLAAGLVGRRVRLPSLLLVYATTVLSSGLLFLALFVFHHETRMKEQFDTDVAHRQAAGQRGEASYPLGPYLWAGLGGASGASLSFVLAGVVLHRQWWSRMFGFVFLAALPCLAAVWVYRTELGILGIPNYLTL